MKCKRYNNSILKENKIKLKDISCTSCAGSYCLDGLGFYKEIKAHCKWCAISEYIMEVQARHSSQA